MSLIYHDVRILYVYIKEAIARYSWVTKTQKIIRENRYLVYRTQIDIPLVEVHSPGNRWRSTLSSLTHPCWHYRSPLSTPLKHVGLGSTSDSSGDSRISLYTWRSSIFSTEIDIEDIGGIDVLSGCSTDEDVGLSGSDRRCSSSAARNLMAVRSSKTKAKNHYIFQMFVYSFYFILFKTSFRSRSSEMVTVSQ